jgi:hypothetical protein
MQNGNGYQGFNDMINGGGAGQSGQSFEGGGLLSMIANMIAKPRGSQQGQPQAQTGGLLSPQARPAMPMPAPQPMQPRYPNTPPPGFQPPTQNPHPQMFQPPMQPRQSPHPPMYQPPTQSPHPPMYQPPGMPADQASAEAFMAGLVDKFGQANAQVVAQGDQGQAMFEQWLNNGGRF